MKRHKNKEAFNILRLQIQSTNLHVYVSALLVGVLWLIYKEELGE